MKFSPSFIPLWVFLLIFRAAEGQELSSFLARHKRAIENYIMAGHGRGWDTCDVVTQQLLEERSLRAVPQWVMELQMLKTLETSLLSPADCLLVTYRVKSERNLQTLMEFGQSVILKKRFALLLKLDSNITLDAVNRTNLPFLVSAEMSSGKEEFLCPVVGKQEAQIQPDMCKQSYTTCKNKVLRVGILGRPPYFKLTRDNSMDGLDVQLLKLLAKKKGFVPNVTVAKNLWASITMVCIYFFCLHFCCI